MSLSKYTAGFTSRETPFYFYDLNLLRHTLEQLNQFISGRPYKVHYALKANVNRALLKIIKDAGLGADCVSGNEVIRALETGFSREEIVFAGVGKTDKEIQVGLDHDIFAFNVESIQELQVLNELAIRSNKVARFALRLNPNVDAGTHEYITTGKRDNKFGVTFDEMKEAIPLIRELKGVEFIGIHFHIGSQIFDMSRFSDLCQKINEIHHFLYEKDFRLPHINVGGGLGIEYENPDEYPIPEFKSYFEVFDQQLELRDYQTLHFELGRAIVGQCGSLISRVLYVKPGEETTFLVLDAGMTELLRPALYRAFHDIENLTSKKEAEVYDVVGPICETSDAFARGIQLPESKRGDLVAIRSTGAYAEVMSSRYNLREVAHSVYSDELG